jgi:hypothetical protein
MVARPLPQRCKQLAVYRFHSLELLQRHRSLEALLSVAERRQTALKLGRHLERELEA